MSRRAPSNSSIAFTLMLKVLLERDGCTAQEIADESGLNRLTIYRWLMVMHRHRVVHVSGWTKCGVRNVPTRLFKLGFGADAKRPRARPISDRQILNLKQNVYRERLRANESLAD
jgi:DNA-binding IclR family transcriptional regulator